MADFDAIAQIAVIPDKKCELCDKNDIEWKCLNCDELICDHCRTTHLKSKASKNHKVVNLKHTDVRHTKESKGNSKCSKHPTEDLQMYCKSCDEPVCRRCITNPSHESHSFELIEDMIDRKQTELLDIIVKSKKKLENVQTTAVSISNYQRNFADNISKRIKEIKTRNNEMKERLDKITSELIRQLQQLEKQNQKQMIDFDRQLQEDTAELRKIIQQCEDKSKERNIEIVNFVTTMTERLNKDRPCDPPNIEYLPELETRNVDDEKELRALFGNLVKSSPKSSQPLASGQQRKAISSVPVIDVKTVNSFTIKNKTRVRTVNDNQAWVWLYLSNDISLVTSDGHVVKDITTDFRLWDVAVTGAGDLLLTNGCGNEIKQLTTDRHFIDLYHGTTGYSTQGITITDKGSINNNNNNNYNNNNTLFQEGYSVS